jgi:hypothetical protein
MLTRHSRTLFPRSLIVPSQHERIKQLGASIPARDDDDVDDDDDGRKSPVVDDEAKYVYQGSEWQYIH